MAYPHELVRAVARGESIDPSGLTRQVVESAVEHRMVGLLLRSLPAEIELPSEMGPTLMAIDMAMTLRRRHLDDVFVTAHEKLTEAGVTHTFVKGPVSATRWFARPADRPYADIDVVVPKGSQFASAVAVFDPSNPTLEALSRGGDDYVTSVVVELDGEHVDIQTDALRTGLPPRSSGGWTVGTDHLASGVQVLDPEHDLIMFLLHQGRDRFRYVLGVAEARLRLSAAIDWARVERLARDDQIAVAVEVMCQELRTEVPVSVPGGWRVRLWRWLWKPKVRLLGEMGSFRYIARARWLMPLTMRGRVLDASGWILQRIFPPDVVLRLKYPEARGPYFWRVVAGRVRVLGLRRLWVFRNRDG